MIGLKELPDGVVIILVRGIDRDGGDVIGAIVRDRQEFALAYHDRPGVLRAIAPELLLEVVGSRSAEWLIARCHRLGGADELVWSVRVECQIVRQIIGGRMTAEDEY